MPDTTRARLGLAVNLALRVAIVAVLALTVAAPADDPRFADKGIGARTLFIVLPLTLGIPALWLWRRQHDETRQHDADEQRGRKHLYPFWIDSLYLSVFALDLAGNWFGWYITYPWFDLIPHFHGGGAGTVVATALFRLSPAGGLAVGNIGHILLEGYEFYSDVVFGTANVHGEADIINDLLVGVAGSLLYLGAYLRLNR